MNSNTDLYQKGVPYDMFLGGVVSFPSQAFEAINGFSNSYFGWGAEDDDLRERLKAKNIIWKRLGRHIGR